MVAKHLVVGAGEVGSALERVLSRAYTVYVKDVGPTEVPDGISTMHIALNYHALGHEAWVDIVSGYIKTYRPRLVDVCSTVAPGTTALLGINCVHSTTRGLHPNLEEGLSKIVKHVGGPRAEDLAREYAACGVRCITHGKAATTELAHLLNNSAYGVSLMFADEAERLCRHYGVDYYEAVMLYTQTHNRGFRDLDHPRLVRSILTPPYGRIGGHCVVQGAGLIPGSRRGLLMSALARYNDAKEESPASSDQHGLPGVPGEDSGKEPLEGPEALGQVDGGGPGEA